MTHPTPLADLVARVRAAPAGPATAAVLDYDGTLIDGFSGLSFIRERLRRRQLGPTEAARIAQAAIRGVRTPEEFAEFLDWSLRAYRGRDVGELSVMGQHVFDDDIAMRLRPEVWALMEAHRQRGHTLVLASSGTSVQLEAIAAATGIPHVIATTLEVVGGVVTGRVDGQAPWGPFKAAAVAALLEELEVDPARSFAYSDGDEDIPLLSGVGHPTAVNPRPALRREARRQGWPVLEGEPVGGGLPVTAPFRTAAMVGGFAGGAALAAPAGVLRRDARTFVDRTISVGSDLSLALGGVQVEVVEGRRHLEDARPCVFIFNHRSNLDALVIMHLLRRDITAVAKQEVADIPGFGQLFRMADAAFIDRADSGQARAAIQPAVDRLRDDGISLVIAPEGARSRTPGIRTFKRGAFHIARQAGVPVVPIVLAGVGERMPPGAQVLRPGKVRAAVLPPVDVSLWGTEELGQRVDELRERMITALVDLTAAP